MLDSALLGTGGMMPLPNRYLTSLMLRYQGSNMLIDCGEATQMALREVGWSCNPTDFICLTHYHADHISGLPGFLLSIGNSDRTKPITIIGPKGLKDILKSMRIICPELPFQLIPIELEEDEGDMKLGEYNLHYFKGDHKITCYGYSVKIHRLPAFDIEKAKKNAVPLKCWNKLQHGESVEVEGVTYTPDQVMGNARKGLKITYATDTRPTKLIEKNAVDSDLFICEGMYGEPDKQENALKYKHTTMREACQLGKLAKPKEMWLTHFSPSEMKPQRYISELKEIFPQVEIVKDGTCKTFRFEGEEE